MNEYKNRKIGIILTYVSIILSIVIQLLYTPFLIRKLGQSDYGLYALINSIIGYLTIFDLGFGNAIVVFTSKYRSQGKIEEEKKLQGMFLIIFIVLGILVGVLGFILYLNIDKLFIDTMTNYEIRKAKIMMIILIFNLVITFFFNIYTCIINAYEKFIYQKLVSIINTILKPIIMIPLLFMGYKSIAMVVVITCLNVIIMFSNYLYCKKSLNININTRHFSFDKKIFKKILKYSVWIFIAVIVDKINWSVDNFVLGAVSGTIAVSVYAVASTINQIFCNLSTAVSGVLLPKMAKMVAKNVSNDEITSEFIKVGRIQYLIVFLMASGLVLFGKQFFLVWAGKGYENAYYIALILIIPACIPLIENLGISILQARNLHKFRSILLLFIAIANIIISIPLSKMYGGIGAAIGTGLSLLIGNGLIINIYYYKKVKIDVIKFWKEIIKMTIPFSIPVIIIVLLMKTIKLSGILNIIIFGIIYVILYCMVCYLLSMNSYEKSLVNTILNKVKGVL